MMNDLILGRFAGQRFNGQAEAAQIIKRIVIIQQAIQVAGPAQIRYS